MKIRSGQLMLAGAWFFVGLNYHLTWHKMKNPRPAWVFHFSCGVGRPLEDLRKTPKSI
jgi:hypothetical protein